MYLYLWIWELWRGCFCKYLHCITTTPFQNPGLDMTPTLQNCWEALKETAQVFLPIFTSALFQFHLILIYVYSLISFFSHLYQQLIFFSFQFLSQSHRNSLMVGHIVSARTSQMIWSIEVPDDVEYVDNQVFYCLNFGIPSDNLRSS